MSLLFQIILYTALSGILSLVGGVFLLGNQRLVKKFSIHLVSFAAGTLLAVSFLDLLPEAVEHAGENLESIFIWALAGIVVFFLFERVIIQLHTHYYEHDDSHGHPTPVLLMVGDAFHNFIDGVVIATAFIANPALGAVTAIGVAIHELPQEIGDFSVLLHHGWSKISVFWINLAISLTSILGAILAYLARDFINPFLPHLLAFTAGIFIYIATSDLLPEIIKSKPSDKKSHITALLLLGILSIWILSEYFGHAG